MLGLHESLNSFNDHKFFSLLEQKEDEKKVKQKDPQQEIDEKEKVQAAKDAMDIVKKVKDNFSRFKSFAGNQVKEYKNFWEMQKKVSDKICSKDPACELCYAMFNDGTSSKYVPNYIVCLRNVKGVLSLAVFKTKLEEGEENPTFSVSNEQAQIEFKSFFKEIKNHIKEIKNHYIKTIETKRKEEEHKKKREKLDKFLKEGV